MAAISISGKLCSDDYAILVPELERLIKEHGKLRLLVELIDFEGWSAGAFWEDAKFDVKHFRDFERIAIVGENTWQRGMAMFCKPFTTATVHYFEQRSEAQDWIYEGLDA